MSINNGSHIRPPINPTSPANNNGLINHSIYIHSIRRGRFTNDGINFDDNVSLRETSQNSRSAALANMQPFQQLERSKLCLSKTKQELHEA